MTRTVKEFGPDEIDLMISYFHDADESFLNRMGVDPGKLPKPNEWRALLLEDLNRPVEEKKFYYLLWEIDGIPVGHSNINKIKYGQEAYMHLHIWKPEYRRNGNGTFFVGTSLDNYFRQFDLRRLFCEPNALNPAPNRTLPKLGFELQKKYFTTPSLVCFFQEVNRWVLTREKWMETAF